MTALHSVSSHEGQDAPAPKAKPVARIHSVATGANTDGPTTDRRAGKGLRAAEIAGDLVLARVSLGKSQQLAADDAGICKRRWQAYESLDNLATIDMAELEASPRLAALVYRARIDRIKGKAPTVQIERCLAPLLRDVTTLARVLGASGLAPADVTAAVVALQSISDTAQGAIESLRSRRGTR